MKAAIFKQRGQWEVKEVPTPVAGPGEVVIRIKYCGICGTDLHFFDSDILSEGDMMGHEYAGVIAEVGEGVTNWQVGDRVVPGLWRPCGVCQWCRRGLFHRCLGGPSLWKGQKIADWGRFYGKVPGAYAEYVKTKPHRLLRIPDEVSFKEAAVVEPLSVAMGSVRLSKIILGDNVAVLGAGPIGLLTLQCAKQAGALNVYVSEGAKARAEAAAKMGADLVFDPREVDVIKEITRLTHIGPDVVFECAAVPATIEGAIELVRRSGRVMLLGVRLEPVKLISADWVLKDVEVQATLGGPIAPAMDMLQKHRIDVDNLVTDIVPLEGIQDAFQGLLKPSAQIKVLVEP